MNHRLSNKEQQVYQHFVSGEYWSISNKSGCILTLNTV